MGQKWAATSPFLLFTDHHQELGRLVTEGRRREFSRFQAFADEERSGRIPDPQAVSTFEASRLKWEEQALAPHAGILELYRSLPGLRRRGPALQPGSQTDAIELDDHGLAVVQDHTQGEAIVLVSWLKEAGGAYDFRRHGPIVPAARWSLSLSTEEPRFQESPGEERAVFAPEIDLEDSPVLRFHRPSAVILRRR